MIAGIFAVDECGTMGCDGALPWKHNKDDMHWFQHATLATTVFMGRKTWESLPQRPLLGRKNVVVSSSPHLSECYRCPFEDLDQYVLQEHVDTDVFIIGGAQLLFAARHLLDTVFVTRIPGIYAGDTFIDTDLFPQGFELQNLRNLELCAIEEYKRSFT